MSALPIAMPVVLLRMMQLGDWAGACCSERVTTVLVMEVWA